MWNMCTLQYQILFLIILIRCSHFFFAVGLVVSSAELGASAQCKPSLICVIHFHYAKTSYKLW